MNLIKKLVFILILCLTTPLYGGPDLDAYISSVVKIKFKNKSATGFLVSADGYILTCGHLFSDYDPVHDQDSIDVYFYEPVQVAYHVPIASLRLSKEKGDTIGRADLREKYSEYALLKVPASNIHNRRPLQISREQVGQLAPTYFVSVGATPTPRLTKRTVSFANPTFLLLSPTVLPGDSGSPLLNKEGDVVGMVLMQHTSSYGGAATISYVNELFPPAYNKILSARPAHTSN